MRDGNGNNDKQAAIATHLSPRSSVTVLVPILEE
jgi:hypothetical protein